MSLVVLVDAREGSRDPGSSVGSSRVFRARVGSLMLEGSIACVHLGVLVDSYARRIGGVLESCLSDSVRGLFDSVRGLSDLVCGLFDSVRGLSDLVCGLFVLVRSCPILSD